MKNLLTRSFAVSGAAALSVLALSPAVFAQSSSVATSQKFQANVQQLNNSGVSGTVTATLNGDKLAVSEHLSGELKGQPHAQHFHFDTSASHTCPTASVIKDNQPGGANDKPFAFGNDKVLESVEARGAYGAPVVSLTTSGDTSAKSALAVDRFSTADNGTITYNRTITLSSDQVKELKANQLVFVTHGIDLNGNGKYDVFGSNKDLTRSALAAAAAGNNNFPLEGTAPAGCGVVTAMGGKGGGAPAPSGAPATGSGSTSGIENVALFAIGGAAIVAAGLTLALTQRKPTSRK